jgi:flagellar motor switch protein FliN
MNTLDPSRADAIMDVPVSVSAQIGSTSSTIGNLLRLKPGSVLVLDEAADGPVSLRANGVEFARGEIVLSGNVFGLRISEQVRIKN